MKKNQFFWCGDFIPEIVDKQNLNYIIQFKACFHIKEGNEPFVVCKAMPWLFYRPEDPKAPLTISDCVHPITKKYYKSYRDIDGKIVKAMPILILTNGDFKLFHERYIITEIEILNGCYFV